MIRLGYTESQLLFYYYLDKNNLLDKNLYSDRQNNLINWLYSTSGFYDKTISGSYFDFDANYIKQTKIYNEYFEKVLGILKNIDCKIQFNFHDHDVKYIPLNINEQFYNYLNYHNKVSKYPDILSFMSNKKILIINNLSPLMKQQYNSGNIKKICSGFPDDVKEILCFENGYTFLNNGPLENILDSYRKLCNKIKRLDFDGVIISAGAYSSLLAGYISKRLKKEVYCCGGELPNYFGIKTVRAEMHSKHLINEYWIPVPEHMKPANYKKIEDGCYW